MIKKGKFILFLNLYQLFRQELTKFNNVITSSYEELKAEKVEFFALVIGDQKNSKSGKKQLKLSGKASLL